MKNINTNLVKDTIISILIVICITLIISIIFYNKISINKVIPQSQEYVMSEEMLEDLNKSYQEDETQIVTTYTIDATDLKRFEATKEYNKGKKNPFAEESILPENEAGIGNNSNNTTEKSTNSAISNSNFYEDKGIK